MFRLHPGEYIDSCIFIDGIYERRFLDLTRRIFHAPMGNVALDVGSNIGNHALYLADCFRQVHCFDPNPIAIERLEKNVELSRLNNITAHAVGLSDRADHLAFVVNREGDLGSSHFSAAGESDSIVLPVTKGDDFVSEHNISGVDFIKIDVENHELEVFTGLKETIIRDRPIVAFEYHGGLVPEGNFEKIRSVLAGYIFVEAKYIDENASLWEKLKWHFAQQGQPSLTRFTRAEPRSYENILAFPDGAALQRLSERLGDHA